jgi:hypothetical protein
VSFFLDESTDLQFTTAVRPHHSLKSETLPTYRARSPYLYPSGTGWSGYTSGRSINVDSVIKVLHTHTHIYIYKILFLKTTGKSRKIRVRIGASSRPAVTVDQGVTQMAIICAQD